MRQTAAGWQRIRSGIWMSKLLTGCLWFVGGWFSGLIGRSGPSTFKYKTTSQLKPSTHTDPAKKLPQN